MSFDEKIIFLLNVPRSGSSLTTAILNNHPDVFAAPESWLLQKMNDLLVPLKNKYGGSHIFPTFMNGLCSDELQEDAIRSFVNTLYAGLTQMNGATFFVDKSPRYFFVLELLDRLYPSSKRIWLIRNPLAVVCSYKMLASKEQKPFHEKWFTQEEFDLKTFDLTYGYWRYYHYFQTQSPEHAYRLYYEQLTARPREEVQQLCAFLGLPYVEGLERYGESAEVTKKLLLKTSHSGDPYVWNHQQPHQDSVDLWKTVLTPSEIHTYLSIMGTRIFTELGYQQVIEDAQQITGKSYQAEPDMAWLNHRHEQWQNEFPQAISLTYRMKVKSRLVAPGESEESLENVSSRTDGSTSMDVLQMKLALRASEHKRARLQVQADHLINEQKKISEIKKRIPFYRYLAPLVKNVLLRKSKKKNVE